MLDPKVFNAIDPTLKAKHKFAIVAHVIDAGGAISFTDLLARHDINKATLSEYKGYLAKAGYIEVMRTINGFHPRTMLVITPEGRDRFARHCEAFRRIAEAVTGK
jgi:DNA-binding MarR family transcriptional regulator